MASARSFPVDPNLPRSRCQSCQHDLHFHGVDAHAVSVADKLLAPPSSDASRSGVLAPAVNGPSCSVLASSHMDHSFVVLQKQQNQAPGMPPRPQVGGAPPKPYSAQSARAMEESFVVVPPPAASVYDSESGADGVGTLLLSHDGVPSNIPSHANNSGFHTTITVLNHAFDIATSQTQVEQPLCLDCMRVLDDKLEKEVEDVKRDIKAYTTCLEQLEGDVRHVLSESDFLQEKLKIEEEERKLQAAIEETEKQCAEVTCQLKELDLKSSRFKELEVLAGIK